MVVADDEIQKERLAAARKESEQHRDGKGIEMAEKGEGYMKLGHGRR